MIFTNDDLRNLLVLLGKTPITGVEALTVAMLQQKINQALQALIVPPPKAPDAPAT